MLKTTKELIRTLWNGELPLGTAFWTYAVAIGFGVNGLCTVLALSLAISHAPPLAILAAFLLALPYNVLTTVAVWRSAARYEGDPKWADLARLASVVWAVILTLL